MSSKLNVFLFFFFIFILSLNYCMQKERPVLFIETNLYKGHNMQQLDSLKVINQLVGTWLWEPGNFPITGKKIVEKNDYKLVFLSRLKIEVYIGGSFKVVAESKIYGKGNDLTIQTEPLIYTAHGTVFFYSNKFVSLDKGG